MSPQIDDGNRPTRQRSNTAFTPFNWRRGKVEITVPQQTDTVAPLSLEALIEALTPPAVPSIAHARALAISLSNQAPTPKIAVINPILATLCTNESPVSLQAAGYDILAAYWDNSGSVASTTADRLACFSLFPDISTGWSGDLWEPRFKALVALIRSGSETVGLESPLIKMLRDWIEGAFVGLAADNEPLSQEERAERQRSVETMVGFLLSLLDRPEFVSRVTETDTRVVLELFGGLIEKALFSSSNNSPVVSPQFEVTTPSPNNGSGRLPLKHHRHHSSLSIPQVLVQKTAGDFIVEAYLRYLDIRLKAIAPVHLKTILPQLFRSLAYYETPLPRLSLTQDSPYQHATEANIMEKLDSLVTGPYSSSCTVILRYHLFPDDADIIGSMRTSLGALRTLRASIRRALMTRLARSYISRTSSMNYTPSGAPGAFDIPHDLVERAWAREGDLSTWDLNRFRSVLCRCIKAWVEAQQIVDSSSSSSTSQIADVILNEIAGMLKDITQAFDQTGDELDYEEIEAVGDVLHELTTYIRIQRYPLARITLSQTEVPSNLVATVSTLVSQVFTETPLHSVLPSIILSLSPHIPDGDTSQLLDVMNDRQNFSPTTPAWLDHWHAVLSVEDLYTPQRALTRANAFNVLQSVWGFVKDIPSYRRPLAELVFSFWKSRSVDIKDDAAVIVAWRMLGDEIVLRSAESSEHQTPKEDESQGNSSLAEEIVSFLTAIASLSQDEEVEYELTSPTPSAHPNSLTLVSPILSRMQSDFPSPIKDREPGIPSVMSLLSSLTSGHSSRSHSQPPQMHGNLVSSEPPSTPMSDPNVTPTSVGAVVALISAFSQLAFTSLAVIESHLDLATRLFTTLVTLLGGTACTKAKLTLLQFFMRLRVDRDHRLYFAQNDYDRDGLVTTLASLIGRGDKDKDKSSSAVDERILDEMELRRTRQKLPLQERTGRRLSRGRGGPPSGSGSSRSRSRAAARIMGHPAAMLRRMKPREPLWMLPETLPFSISSEADTPSERLASYDPACPDNRIVLRLSSYLAELVNIIRTAKDWDLLSYVLCHLPTQLANKHLFCGPRSKAVLKDLLASLCNSIQNGTLGSSIERWQEGIVARDAQGLAYNTLTVLISYKRCFGDIQSRHKLIEVFLAGLSGQPSTVKCCLNALALSAFELQPSMTKYLPRILEKLSQIMSNPTMAVHIIDFLAIVGSLPDLHNNFTEADYKMVFGVALQYLQQHNHPDASVTISWALSQHVCIMAYYIVYLWFLAVELPDRPRHIKYITRQLLLANEGNDDIDESTEVCFDWLARYTYGSADPRPANSMLNDMTMNSSVAKSSSEPAILEKTWILGCSVVTIRALAKRGWVEVISRRASGLSKFLCRAENVPMITPGDVDPDILSLSASLVLDRTLDFTSDESEFSKVYEEMRNMSPSTDSLSRPDPITGYVWSKSAPSQRRKDVAIDPSYFALQLSSYPDNKPSTVGRMVVDSSRLPAFFRSLDRMPVIDTHKVGIMYVAPGQNNEQEILENTHGSPAYTRFLEGIGRLIDLRGQVDVYAGGLDPDEDGEYAYAWWDDIGQILYHTATLMPSGGENSYTNKKRHIGNDYVRIIWNDSGLPYKFDTLSTQFQFVNIVIEPHSRGAIAAFSNNLHENEYFKVTLQKAPGMSEFTPVGEFKLISAEKLPLLVRQLSLLTDWFVDVYQHTKNDTSQVEKVTNWRHRLQAIKRFRAQVAVPTVPEQLEGIMGQESFRDFTTAF